MLNPLAMVDVLGIGGGTGDDISLRRVEDAEHLLFFAKEKMHKPVEGIAFDGEATTQSTEGFVLLKDYGTAHISCKHVPYQLLRCLLRLLLI